MLKTDYIHARQGVPAEHLSPLFLVDQIFSKRHLPLFKLVDRIGCSIVYSHRIYGEKVGDRMSKWFKW